MRTRAQEKDDFASYVAVQVTVGLFDSSPEFVNIIIHEDEDRPEKLIVEAQIKSHFSECVLIALNGVSLSYVGHEQAVRDILYIYEFAVARQ